MDVLGGGVLMAAAAVLWVAYLLPTWLRRRQYLASERNAVRLGQTIRILAETSETPEPVLVAATARDIASQQRILHEHEETARFLAEAAEQRAIAERIAAEDEAREARELALRALATQPVPVVVGAVAQVPDGSDVSGFAFAPDGSHAQVSTDSSDARVAGPSADRRRLRRRRARRSLLLLASFATLVAGLVGLLLAWPWWIPVAGGVGVFVALAELRRLARVGRRAVPAPVAVPVHETVEFEPIELAEPEADEHGWTPQPLPRPLTLSRGSIAAAAMASIEAAEELRRASVEAELAERAAELVPEPPRLQPQAPAAEASASSEAPETASNADNPYARMGIVDDATPGFDSLDAVLRRRRQAV